MLSKDAILERTNKGLNVFKHYIKCDWRVGRNFLNPLYKDRKASCNIYLDRNKNVYKLKDFGNDSYSGDCFNYVGILFNLNCNNTSDFVEILRIIDSELHLGLSEGYTVPAIPEKKEETVPSVPVEKKIRPYNFIEKDFTDSELRYWGQYGITEEILSIYNVCSLEQYSSQNEDGKPFSFHCSPEQPLYGYKGKRYIKIYRPLSDIRFLYGGNSENYCFGLEQLPAKGKALFITGGEKDVLSLACHGFSAICFNSESVHIPEELIYKLTFRFKEIILLYDVDKTGIDSSLKQEKKLSKYNVKSLFLPLSGIKTEKDISDYFRSGKTREDFFKFVYPLI